MTPMPKVLIVEDDEVIAQAMARHLRAAGVDPELELRNAARVFRDRVRRWERRSPY